MGHSSLFYKALIPLLPMCCAHTLLSARYPIYTSTSVHNVLDMMQLKTITLRSNLDVQILCWFWSVWATSFFIYLAFLKVKRSEKVLFWGRKMLTCHVWETEERVWRVFSLVPVAISLSQRANRVRPEPTAGLTDWIRRERVALQLSHSRRL